MKVRERRAFNAILSSSAEPPQKAVLVNESALTSAIFAEQEKLPALPEGSDSSVYRYFESDIVPVTRSIMASKEHAHDKKF